MSVVSCPECTSPSRPYFKSGATNFQRCNNCGIVWSHPIPSDSELADIYRQAYSVDNIEVGTTNQESGDYATKAYAAFIDKYLVNKDENVLDYGAATGSLLVELRARGHNCNGYEFSSDAREYCHREHDIALFDAPDSIPRGHYHLITMIEVIEHFREPGNSLRYMYNFLQPGGRIFLTTPNRHGWRARLEGGEWCEARKPFHLYLFDQSSLTRLLANAGFTVERRVRFSPVTRPGFLRGVWVRCMQLVGLGGTLCLVARRSN